MKKEKRNNNSENPSDWTTPKLKNEANYYHDIIENGRCHGTRDIMWYDSILGELEERGVQITSKLF